MAVGVPLLRVPDEELYNSKRMKLSDRVNRYNYSTRLPSLCILTVYMNIAIIQRGTDATSSSVNCLCRVQRVLLPRLYQRWRDSAGSWL
jgi:hypothetical protein